MVSVTVKKYRKVQWNRRWLSKKNQCVLKTFITLLRNQSLNHCSSLVTVGTVVTRSKNGEVNHEIMRQKSEFFCFFSVGLSVAWQPHTSHITLWNICFPLVFKWDVEFMGLCLSEGTLEARSVSALVSEFPHYLFLDLQQPPWAGLFKVWFSSAG